MTSEKSVPLAIVAAGALIAAALYWRGAAPVVTTANQPVTLDTHLIALGEAVGVKRAVFEQCLTAGTGKAAITADQQAGVAAGVTGTPSFVVNGERVDGAVPLEQFQQVIEAALGGKKGDTKVALTSDNPTLGSESAPVTMVEFSDFECPFCQQFHMATFAQLKSRYVDTGKVRYVFKDFPLTNIHPHAQRAAEAAACAQAQGKFWEYAETLFTHQAEWKS